MLSLSTVIHYLVNELINLHTCNIFICQIVVFIMQLKYSQNPAAVAKISLASTGLHAILDAIMCVAHMLLSAALSKYLNHSYIVMVSLLQLCVFGVLEMRLMMRIVLARYVIVF